MLILCLTAVSDTLGLSRPSELIVYPDYLFSKVHLGLLKSYNWDRGFSDELIKELETTALIKQMVVIPSRLSAIKVRETKAMPRVPDLF